MNTARRPSRKSRILIPRCGASLPFLAQNEEQDDEADEQDTHNHVIQHGCDIS